MINKDHILIKSLCLLKVNTAQKVLKEFASKSWNEQSSEAAK